LLYGFFYPHSPRPGPCTSRPAHRRSRSYPSLRDAPGTVAEQKLEGTFDYIWSLPSPRSARPRPPSCSNTLLALPGRCSPSSLRRGGTTCTLCSRRSWSAVLLCALMAITVGYGMALASQPMVTNVVTNALMFVVLLFSPIVYPVSQLPRWLATVHYSCPSTTWPSSSGRPHFRRRAHVATSSSSWWRGPPRWRGDCIGSSARRR